MVKSFPPPQGDVFEQALCFHCLGFWLGQGGQGEPPDHVAEFLRGVQAFARTKLLELKPEDQLFRAQLMHHRDIQQYVAGVSIGELS